MRLGGGAQIDLDTIETSNLNRQFLFRKHHVGSSKAATASAVVQTFAPGGTEIRPYHANIKEAQFDVDFFKRFDLVLNGLDNLEARRHVNRLCLAAERPLVESGTAGYLGQVRCGAKRGWGGVGGRELGKGHGGFSFLFVCVGREGRGGGRHERGGGSKGMGARRAWTGWGTGASRRRWGCQGGARRAPVPCLPAGGPPPVHGLTAAAKGGRRGVLPTQVLIAVHRLATCVTCEAGCHAPFQYRTLDAAQLPMPHECSTPRPPSHPPQAHSNPKYKARTLTTACNHAFERPHGRR